MKKCYILSMLLLSLLFSGCKIEYSFNIGNFGDDDNISDDSNNNDDSNDDSNTDTEDSNNDNNQDDNTNENENLEKPDIIDPIQINEDALFYPSSLSKTSPIVTEYTYIDSGEKNNYRIYSAYYSQYYDTLYIAYDSISHPVQTLKAKDLYQIERHALNYFITDLNKTDYKDYLKAVLIYPDTLGSACRRSLSDDDSRSINGCANYVGQESVISLNKMSTLEDFYKDKRDYIDSINYYQIDPGRYTFAHEFGHISTFYNMAYKNDEDYEDYLKLRLGSLYSTIYPSGLPKFYDGQSESYYTQPSEILADDYVEIFYNTSKKVSEDTYDYTLNYNYTRNSLRNYSSIHNLDENKTLLNSLKMYYTNNFLNYKNKKTYSKPIVISSQSHNINYYESYSKIGKANASKTITSKISVNLIAVGEVIVNDIKYYRVILSNTFNTSNNSYDEKQVGKKMGYVKATSYTVTTNLKIYEINYDKQNNTYLTKNSMVPIRNFSTTYILPFYDFSYVLDLDADQYYATTYDYLNTKFTNQTYQVHIYSFGTLVN